MSYRAPAAWLHPDSLRALNSIDTVFHMDADKPVRDAWSKVISHAYTKRPDWNADQDGAKAWDNRLLDLRVDMYQLMGAAVGYNLSLDYIKTQMYYPQLHVDTEADQMQIRKQFLKAITDDGLKVVLVREDLAPGK